MPSGSAFSAAFMNKAVYIRFLDAEFLRTTLPVCHEAFQPGSTKMNGYSFLGQFIRCLSLGLGDLNQLGKALLAEVDVIAGAHGLTQIAQVK